MVTKSTILAIEAYDLIGSTTILGVLYGITFTLYCLCAWQLYLQLHSPDNKCQARFSLGYISLLFLCTTGLLALNARMSQVTYIDHPNFPGGPLEFERSCDPTCSLYFLMVGIFDFLMEVLTLVIQIRRLWIVWSGTQYAVVVTILPVMLLLFYIALDIPLNIVTSLVPFTQLRISHSTQVITAYYAALSACTILVTGLIAARLLYARRQHAKILGMSEVASPYLSIVAMLVESYILEATWSLASAISSNPLFVTNDSTIKVIAYFLVVYRVETGRGWTKQTGKKLTTLQWNHGAQTATDGASSIQP